MTTTPCKRAKVSLFLLFIVCECSITNAYQFTEISNLTLTAVPSALVGPNSTNGTQVTKENGKIVIRKCCGLGEVYHSDSNTGDKQCIKYSITSSSSLKIKTTKQQLLAKDEQLPPDFSQKNFTVVQGFPQNCSSEPYRLEPDLLYADKFFALESGQLLVPHRFWFFQSEDYCIEEFFEDKHFIKGQTVAITCFSNRMRFPETAVNSVGKLSLNFLQASIPENLSKMLDKKVVRKCCDLNEALSMDYNLCVPNEQNYATPLYSKYFIEEKNISFLRVEPLGCSFHEHYTFDFNLTSSGNLAISLYNQSQPHLISLENYCIDDFIETDRMGLPRVYFLAHFCSEEPLNLVNPHLFSFNQQVFPDANSEAITKVIDVPKCCLSDSVVAIENRSCELFKPNDPTLPSDSIVYNAINYQLLNWFNISASLIPNSSITCGFKNFYHLRKFDVGEGDLALKSFGGNELSVSMHYHREQVWDHNDELKPFCMDLGLFHNPESVHLAPMLFYCEKNVQVPIAFTTMLIVSTVALIATIITYHIVPVSGSAKFVTSTGGGKKKSTTLTMAKMLTGRILLCHIFTLAMAFMCLVTGQLGWVEHRGTGCIILGFITYGFLVASFAWLTVYCFDYFRIFRGSFKVANDVLFLPYSAFGWGVPILLMMTTVIIQFQPNPYGSSSTINPNMGVTSCWFSSKNSEFFFFFLPMSILLLLNIGFFTSLLFNRNLMNCWKKNLSLRNNQNNLKGSKEAQDVKMAIKLFFITGIPWVFEIIVWAHSYFNSDNELRGNLYYLIQITNLFNYLRGVIVFIVFVLLQRDVRRYLIGRFRKIVSKEGISTADQTRTNDQTTDFGTMSSVETEHTSC